MTEEPVSFAQRYGTQDYQLGAGGVVIMGSTSKEKGIWEHAFTRTLR